ncbi:MAG: HIT family protein [Candidatus Eisenbacteria bacterium]|jgi:histidine triad (HIT) family protein|nr:HIT family protein [Candidatus Eisenbacteria bacterium]
MARTELELFEDSPACAFCAIVEGRVPCRAVFEDSISLAFLDHRPLVHGHCLLVPKAHHATLPDLPHDLVAPLFATARLLSIAVQRGMGAEGSFLAINTIVSQSVPHIHVHIMPRWTKDGLFSMRMIWQRRPYRSPEDMTKVQEAISRAMGELCPEGNPLRRGP